MADVPVWVDGAPPARNATNLNKLSNAIQNIDARVGTLETESIDQATGDTRYVNETDHTKAAHDLLNIDADTLDGQNSTDMEHVANKGIANGYAPLGADLKVPTANLPASVAGGLTYQGTWNATTNTPAIPTAAPANNGYYYKVAVAGTTNISGITSWAIGDWIISNGASWDKIVQADAVSSVFGRTGAVVAVAGDYWGSDINMTAAAPNRPSANVGGQLADLDTNKANATHAHSGADITSGTVPVARIGTGTKDTTTFYRGDGTFAVPAGGGGGSSTIQDDGTAQGTATTLNFGTNVAATVAGGVATINASVSTGTISGTAKADTIAALRAINTTSATTVPDGTTYTVLGYNFAGDRAGPRTYRLYRSFPNSGTTAHNGGTFISPTTGTGMWRLEDAQWTSAATGASPQRLNICWFGARGDYNASTNVGTDDTAAIQACVDAVDLTLGAHIDVPGGMYKLSATITTAQGTNMPIGFSGRRVFGKREGPGVQYRSTFVATGTMKWMFQFRPPNSTDVNTAHTAPTFYDIGFYDDTTARTATAVAWKLSNHGYFHRCFFRNLLRGVYIDSRQVKTTTNEQYGWEWTANARKFLGHAIARNVGGSWYQFIVDSTTTGTHAGNAGATDPGGWSATFGSTVADGQLVWKNNGPMHNLGDAAWTIFRDCDWLDCREGIYVAHSGNITVQGGAFYGEDPTATDTRFIRIEGGGYHRISHLKIEEVEYGIETYGSYSSLGPGLVYEDCRYPVWVRKNTGVASGVGNQTDGLYAGNFETPVPGPAITYDSGCTGYIGANRNHTGHANTVTNNATGVRVQSLPATGTYTGA